MYINIKGAPIEAGIKAVQQFDLKTMELQLLDTSCRNVILPEDKLITVIHPAIIDSVSLNVNRFLQDVNLEEIYCVFKLCAFLSNKQGVVPAIIIHMSGSATVEKGVSLVTRIEDLKKMYKIKPRIVFENVTPHRASGLFDNGFFKEPVKMANICNQLSLDQEYGTCLDICHAQATVELYKLIGLYDLNLSDFFKLYAPTCKLIHWNAAIGLALTTETHSRVVSRELAEVLHDMYEEYDFKADITIEVSEEGYTKYGNFKVTYDNMKNLFE